MLLFLLVLFHVSVEEEECVNNVNGAVISLSCDEGCCLEHGSYSVDLRVVDVCEDPDTGCYNTPNLPTSCPIVVAGEELMYGCGVGEVCCFSNHSQELYFQYTPPVKEDVCSVGGVCHVDAREYFGTEYTFKNTRDPDSNSCYLMTNEERGFEHNICDDGKCCYRNYTQVRDAFSVCSDSCLENIVTDECVYELYDNRFYSRIDCYNEDRCCAPRYSDKMHPQLRLLCAPEDSEMCAWRHSDYEDFYLSRNKEKDGLEVWIIILIVLIILVLMGMGVLLFVLMYIKYKSGAVGPKDDLESPIFMEDFVVDERAQRLFEVESHLDDAIASNDMADLKLAIDNVEYNEFQGELEEKYKRAKEMFEELVARSEEEKKRELEEAEKQADIEKKKLEEAEKELERRRREEAELAAIREAKRLRDEAKVRWNKLWPRLQILRALISVNEDAMAKAIEEARRHKEEEDRLKREAEERARKIENCRQLLDHGIKSSNEDKLAAAIDITAKYGFEDELKELYKRAEAELDRLRKDRARKEEELRLEKERKDRELAERKAKEKAEALAKLDKIQEALRNGITKEDMKLLEAAVADVEQTSLGEELKEDYEEAKALLARLLKTEKIKRAILELKRPLIAELRSFTVPPSPVLKSMVATFMLMGESKQSSWKDIVILLNRTGKMSVKRRVQNLQVEEVSVKVAKEASEYLVGLTSDEVYEANQAASLFFDWAQMICHERGLLEYSR